MGGEVQKLPQINLNLPASFGVIEHVLYSCYG